MSSRARRSRGAAARLWALARPRGALLIASIPLVGFGFGLWERGSDVAPWIVAPTVGLLFAAWISAHAGAMWLNAELDRDEGGVLFGEPVVVPKGTALAGYAALALSVAIASRLGTVTTACAAICAILAVLYSHPRIALKGQPIGGPLVNGVGYGMLSPLAGWAAAETPPTWRGGLVLVLGACFVLATYFSAQAFQEKEDAERGYRTLVVTHGPRWTLGVARGCLFTSTATMVALAIVGAFPRAALLPAPLWFFADRHLVRWQALPGGGTSRDGARFVGWLALGIVAGVIAAYVDHFTAMALDAPLGGCGTAIVPDALAEVCAR